MHALERVTALSGCRQTCVLALPAISTQSSTVRLFHLPSDTDVWAQACVCACSGVTALPTRRRSSELLPPALSTHPQYSLALPPANTVVPGYRHASVRAVENALLHTELPAALSVVPGGFENVSGQLHHFAASLQS